MKKFDIGENTLLLALIIIFVGCSFLVNRKPLRTPQNTQQTECLTDTLTKRYDLVVVELAMIDEYGNEEPTQDAVLYVMSRVGIEHPHIAYAQMLLESGHFNSNLVKTNNNYFGMKQPCVRNTVSLGKKNGYASYKNWAWSVLDYALWQWHCAKNLTQEEYLALLGRMYAEDERYVEKIKSISENLI